ncbi:energy-coupling factor transporter transmembrane component T family protein [Tabrizicola aquatica]|uniref:energy-coupling factor transporter transmembrane component T family protein n=1 Tax=Tabrizicola aquatica TaxID=909926 RepID=UPI000CD10A40|nr:energy-coupling factor transporter transmembrane component T [Tabrizicola aquatica]
MLSALHPLPKLALCLIWIAALVLVFDLRLQLAGLILALGLLWGVERIALGRLVLLMVPFALFGFGLLTTSVLFHRESGFVLQMAQEQGAAQPDAAPGLVLFTRVLACGMISTLFALTTDPGRLVRVLMIHLRLPAAFGFAMLQAMHIVPDLRRELLTLRMARAMRRGRPMRRVPGPTEVMSLAIPLLAFAIRRATRAAIAMEARGLRPGQPRTHLPQPPVRGGDIAALAGGVILLIGLLMAL